MNILKKFAVGAFMLAAAFSASAQKYSNGLVDKTVAVVGNASSKSCLTTVELNVDTAWNNKLS